MPSLALGQVRALYPEVDQLLLLGNDLRQVRQRVCARAAVVLTHAHLEAYVATVVPEFLDYLNRNARPRTRWHDEIHTSAMVDALAADAGRVVNAEGEQQARTRTRQLVINVRAVDRVSRSVPLRPAAILGDLKYPKLDNILLVFSRLVLPGIVQDLSQADGVSYGFALTTLNEDRGAIAHGDAIAPSIADVRQTIRSVRRFMASLDRRLAVHAQTHVGSLPW